MSKWKKGLSWLCILAVLVTFLPASPTAYAIADEVAPDTSNVNLALLAVPAKGGSIVASNVGWTGNPAEKVNDGKLDSGRWAAGGSVADHTVDLTFTSPQTINKAVIYNYRGSQSETRKRIVEFKLQYSNDEGAAKEWSDAYHRQEKTVLPGGSNTGSPNPNVFEFPAFTAKYVRLYIIQGDQPSIFEFQLFNDWRDPLITTTALQDGKEGAAYSAELESRGKLPFTWTLESGTLPVGMNLAADGTISGMPAPGTAGDYTFTVKAVNSYTLTGAAAPVSGSYSRELTLKIHGSDSVLPIDLNVPGELTIPAGEIRRIKAADGTPLTFVSDDTEVAEIENNGFIFGKAPGTAVITGTTSDGSGRVGLCSVTVETQNYTDIERMRRKYRESMVPYGTLDLADPVVKDVVNSVYASAEELYEGQDGLKNKIVDGKLTGPRPWTISTEAVGSQSYPVGTHYNNVYTLAQAFLLPGKYYHDPELYDDIVITLEWLLQNVFKNSGISNKAALALIEAYGDTDARTQGSERSANWYHYGLGIPSSSGRILTLLADTGFPQDLMEAYCKRIHIFSPTSNDRFNMESNPEAANKIDSCIIMMTHGLLANNEARVRQAASELFSSGTIETDKTSGNGYYWDGSHIAHTNWAYSLGYGISILNGLCKVISVVGGETINGSPITFNETYFNRFMNTFDITYLTSVWKGAAMPGLGGRGISRQGSVEGWTRSLSTLLCQLYPVVPVEKQAAVKAAVKSWVQHEPEILNSTNLSQNRALYAFISDAIPAAGEREGIFAQNNQSRVLWREDDFAFSVSTNNTNINTFPFEVGNGENFKGVHTGDGMTYLFLENDINQYAGSFFATADPPHMPGSTVEIRADGWQAYTRDNGPNSRRNSKHTWAGTSVLTDKDGKQYGASGFLMDLSGTTAEGTGAPSTLDMDVTANKSWFMLGDKIVALGSNVTSTKGRPVDTTIESRRLPSGGGILTYNGESVSTFEQKTTTTDSYAHLSYGDGAQVGYYFPKEGQNISIGLKDHTGSWYETNHNCPNSLITEPYADIYLNHGQNPTGDTYEYVLLPNYSAEQTAAFAAAPNYRVVKQTDTLHAVYDNTAKVLLINNFASTAASVTSPETGIVYEIDRAASVIIREHDDGQVEVGILDPTSGNNSVTVTIKDREGYKLSGDNMTVTQVGGNITAKVAAPAAEGKKFNTWQATLDILELNEEIPPPNPPKNAAGESIDAYSAKLTWEKPDNAGDYTSLTYELRYMFKGTEQVIEVPGDTNSFYVYPLEKGTAYEFSVFSKDRGALSQTAAKANGITQDYTAPIDFEWADVGDTVVGTKVGSVTAGTLGNRPFWAFNDTGMPGENKATVVQDNDTKALEVTSGASANTNGQLSYNFPSITSGVFEFSFRVKASGGDGIMNGIHLLGTVNGIENVPVVSVVSDTGKWTYEIMNNDADKDQTTTNARPWKVDSTITSWVTIRMIVDFDKKVATVLVDDKVLVKDEAFRYRSGLAAGSSSRYANDKYAAITGFQVKSRWGGNTGNAIRVDDFYITPQALDGTVKLDSTAPDVGETVIASYDGYHIGDLTYAWTVGDQVISGSSASYTVAAGDEGKTLMAVVTSSYETGSQSASLTVTEDAIAPGITGGETSKILTEGYAAYTTPSFVIDGSGMVNVSLAETTGNPEGKITWDDSSRTIRVAVGLAVGEYTVTLTADNGVAPHATFEFTLTVVSAPDSTVDIAAIGGVTAPERGATPVTNIAKTAQYTGTVTWSPADSPFATSRVYTATITLMPKTGYTLTGVTENFFTVEGATSVTNAANSGVIQVVFPETHAAPSENGGAGYPSTPTTPSYSADVTAGNGLGSTLPINVDAKNGTASVNTGSQRLGQGGTVITIPSIPNVDTYMVGIPLSNLSKTDAQGTITIDTNAGSVTIPSNMLTGVSGISGSKAEISIGQGAKDSLPDNVKAAIGDKPLIQLTLSIDSKPIDWSNPNASVTVSIPYAPTAAELANHESIVIRYIDGSGSVVTIPNGHYDSAAGMVTFQTTHFSHYAVVYNKVSFQDVAPSAWYNKAVSFIAAREIASGTGTGNYSPEVKLTRGEFIVLMMRAYGIMPDENSSDNFSDAGSTYYTGYLATAKRLGITAGIGNNRYEPDRELTRQEMFTLMYNALKVIGQLPQSDSGKTLSDFTDAGQIDAWAKAAMTLLVKTGTVGGNAGKLAPISTTTRAEMAQVLYNLLGK